MVRIAIGSLGAVIVSLTLGAVQTQADYHLPPQNMPLSEAMPLKVFPAMPPGFNPLTATNAQLETYGLPTPPADPSDLAVWKVAMLHAKYRDIPHPQIMYGVWHSGTVYQNNWAGYYVVSSDNNSAGSPEYTQTYASWYQPSVSPSGYTGSLNPPAASFWTGIGYLDEIQAGVDSIAGTTSTSYRFWTEDAPNPPVEEGPVVNGGDEIYVHVTYNGNGTATYFLENITSDHYQSFTNSTPYVDQSTADFINEWPLHTAYLADFGTTDFFGCGMNYTIGGTNYPTGLSNTVPTKVIMTTTGTASGTPMSTPGTLNVNEFGVTWNSP